MPVVSTSSWSDGDGFVTVPRDRRHEPVVDEGPEPEKKPAKKKAVKKAAPVSED